MSEQTETQKSWTRFLPKIGLTVLVLMALVVAYSVILQPGPGVAFQPFSILLLVNMVVLVLGLLVLLWGLFKKRDVLKNNGAKTAAIALVPVAIGLYMSGSGLSAPPIHDISTDLDNPPEFVAAAEHRAEGENPLEHGGEEVSNQQRTAYPDIQPIETDASADAAYRTALAAVEALGWEVMGQNAQRRVIEAVDTTPVFGFQDDVIIRVTANSNGSRVDVRSQSRIGLGDAGVNAQRVRRFIDEYNN